MIMIVLTVIDVTDLLKRKILSYKLFMTFEK